MPQSRETTTPTTPKPKCAVKLALGEIPSELKKFDRWILWKYTWIQPKPEKPGKWTKTPHSAKNGGKIDATNLDNGVDFIAAVQALKKRTQFDGLGFLLGNGIAGIDVDDCIDDEGNLNERGQRMSQAYAASYAEVSPSGRGFKVLVNIGDDPKLAAIGKNTKELEIYGGRRYFTVTGAKLPGHASIVASMAEAFAETAAQIGISPQSMPVADMPSSKAGEQLGWGLDKIRELFDHLPFSYVDEYGDWLKGLMAIHHETDGSAEGLELARELSQRSSKYDEGCVEAKWETFGKPGKLYVTMRSLVYEARQSGWRAPPDIESAIAEFSGFQDVPIVVDDDGVITSEHASWWEKYSIGPMLRTAAPPPQWIFEGVLRKGKALLLAGSGGSSKSYLMLAAAHQYALGNEWGPFKLAAGETPGRVLLMYGEEDKDDVHTRTQALKDAFMLSNEQIDSIASRVAVLPLRGSRVEFARQDPKTRAVVITEQLTRLEERIKQYNIALVVMDPLALLHDLEENDNRAIAAFMQALDAMCMRTGCALIIVHHFGKGGVMSARDINETNVRGASSLAAHARSVVIMHRLREDEATSWGVAPDDHNRWVMWMIAKTNYTAAGTRYWFNVDQHTGALSPAQTQLQYVSAADLRAAAQAHLNGQMDQDISDREFHKAQKEAMEAIQINECSKWLLEYAMSHGGLPGKRKAGELAKDAHKPWIPHICSKTVQRIKDENLVDPTDGFVNEKGRTWLEAYDFDLALSSPSVPSI